MKKIPTLFERKYENHRVVEVLPNCHAGMEWVLEGEGVATVKWDGACCAMIDGKFYKRYDAKRGKTPPEGAIPCSDPDPVTGHWPHWVPVCWDDPSDKWFVAAWEHDFLMGFEPTSPRTYEAVGPHFQGNPYYYPEDMLIPHGIHEIVVPRSFEGIRDFLETVEIEGIVFWRDGEPRCKIKRSDFGFPWPCGGNDCDKA